MRIKDEIFCLSHIQRFSIARTVSYGTIPDDSANCKYWWEMCHNKGWASNILIVVDIGYTSIHLSKYWMPIHYTMTSTENAFLHRELKSMCVKLNAVFQMQGTGA